MEPVSEDEKKQSTQSAEGFQKTLRVGIEILKFATISLAIVLPIRIFIAQPYVVSGASMEPAISFNEYLVVDKLSMHFEKPKRGEVLVFSYPLDTSVIFVKRVIGLPGETVRITGSSIEVSSTTTEPTILAEPYVISSEFASSTVGKDEVTLGPDEYFMMGDNRVHSSDSREWGPLRERYIIGRAFLRVFPLSRFSLFPATHHFEK